MHPIAKDFNVAAGPASKHAHRTTAVLCTGHGGGA